MPFFFFETQNGLTVSLRCINALSMKRKKNLSSSWPLLQFDEKNIQEDRTINFFERMASFGICSDTKNEWLLKKGFNA